MWKFFTAAKLTGRKKEKHNFFHFCSEDFFFYKNQKMHFEVEQQLLFAWILTLWWWCPVFSGKSICRILQMHLLPFHLEKLRTCGQNVDTASAWFEEKYCGWMLIKIAGLYLPQTAWKNHVALLHFWIPYLKWTVKFSLMKEARSQEGTNFISQRQNRKKKLLWQSYL